MSSRINLRLPTPDTLNFERPNSVNSAKLIPSNLESRVSKSRLSQTITKPRIHTSNSLKNVAASESVRDTLKKTTDNLKAFSSESQKKARGLSLTSDTEQLKKEIMRLEMEKDEILAKNRELQQKLNETSVSRAGSNSQRLLKIAGYFVSKVKNSLSLKKSFEEFFSSEESFYELVKNREYDVICENMFMFALENFKDSKESISPMSTSLSLSSRERDAPEIVITNVSGIDSQVSNDDIARIFNESDLLSQNIAAHKAKIQKIYENVKNTMNKTNGILDRSKLRKDSSDQDSDYYNH